MVDGGYRVKGGRLETVTETHLARFEVVPVSVWTLARSRQVPVRSQELLPSLLANMALGERHADPLAVYAAHSFADDQAYQVSRLL
jgi:hypothetical protein